MSKIEDKTLLLPSYPWRISYRTSTINLEGNPTNILHDFYIPALKRSVRYDRVAGYFRSTSLAAASQGFSAFTEHKGQARFIVGADLDPEDVRILINAGQKGNFAELESLLGAELENISAWPEEVKNGVALLGWMISKGYLDLKIACRIHAQTGEPIPFDAASDGYVHMKWAIFRDSEDNALYVSGSLNESRQALMVNAENIDVHCSWKGEVEAQRSYEAQQEFDILWSNNHPHFQILSLPEAIKHKLISFAEKMSRPIEIDGTSAAPIEISAMPAKERLHFALLKDGPFLPRGRYVGMETAPVRPWPHQNILAKRVLSTYPFSYLLCDEVGLGKTIEAGLVIRSLVLSGLAPKVLIAAPASLTRQWLREMADKFLLPFSLLHGGQWPKQEKIFPEQDLQSTNSIFNADLGIVSTGLLVRSDRFQELQQTAPFDLALVDEAHYARRKNPTRGLQAEPRYGLLYDLINGTLRNKAECLLLSTATPMQLDAVEVFDLMSLTNRVSAFQQDPGLTYWYFSILGRLVDNESIEDEEWEFLRNCLLDLEQHDPFYMDFLHNAVVDSRFRTSYRRFREDGRIPRGRDKDRMQRLFFAASPLSRVMLRHTRALLEIYRDKGELQANLAKRQILPLPRITYTENERRCYDRLEQYCRELAAKIRTHSDSNNRASIGFYLSFLRLRFASSFYAVTQTLKRRLDRVEKTLKAQDTLGNPEGINETELQDLLDAGDEDRQILETVLQNRSFEDLEWEQGFVQELIKEFDRLPPLSSKMKTLLEILEQRVDEDTGRFAQTVIFTRFYDTLCDIVSTLLRQKPRLLLGTYSGQSAQYMDSKTWRLVGTDRETVKHRFLHKSIDILVCTDAAAEGLNLQTADLLINFDLPWNPMKVEQRIGRIDRIGQENESVQVINLCYADSAEATVYGRLLQRLATVDKIVGTQQISLLPVDQQDFQDLIEKKVDEQTLEAKVQKRLEETKARIASREIPANELYKIYTNLERSGITPQSPINLDSIWSALSNSQTMHDLGCTIISDPEKKTLKLKNIPDIPDGTLLTSSRHTFEYGLDHQNAPLHFSSYGDPVFDRLLNYISGFDLPSCAKRIEVQGPQQKSSLVGYVVATKSENMGFDYTLVKSPQDLQQIQLDENVEVAQEIADSFKDRLYREAANDFETLIQAGALERENIKAALSQQIFNYLLMQSIMQFNIQIGIGEALFWEEVKNLQDQFAGKDAIQVTIVDNRIRKLTGLIFEPYQYSTGNKAVINAPISLLQIALDAVCRLANSMHRAKSELETAQVLARMEREMDRLEAKIAKLE